jgi:hypothetical protein
MKTAVLIVLFLVVAIGAAAGWGAWRWNRGTLQLRAQLEAGRVPTLTPQAHTPQGADLPSPVQRFFQAALQPGRAPVAAVSLAHRGTFNMGEGKEQWRPFTSTQRVVTQRPGFDWDGRIRLLPGVAVHVHDAYVAGQGLLHASLLGLVTLADMRGTADTAQGELMRYLAEAAWYPTALLPSQGVRWTAVDDGSADATLSDGPTTVTLRFSFNPEGLIDGVSAAARARTVAGQVVYTPWRGRFWNHHWQDGLRVPMEGEVAWQLPAGLQPYWRGRVVSVAYEPVH